MPKRLGQIDTKDINYYSGQDRDPNTGLPKGLKSHSSVRKDTGVMDESLLGKIRQTLTGASSEINESVSEDIVQHDKLVKAIRNSEASKLTQAKLLKTAAKVRGLKSEDIVNERLGGKGYSKKATGGGGDWEDSDRGEGNKATRRSGGTVKVKSPTYLAYIKNKKKAKVSEGSAYGLWKGDGKRKLPGDKKKKVTEQELKEYSPNVTYQAKGGKKSGKLGKSSVYSLRGDDESKKDFRKSHTKDIKDGLVKKESYATARKPSELKKKAKLEALLQRIEDRKKKQKESVKESKSYKDYMASVQQAKDRKKAVRDRRKEKDASFVDRVKHGIKFYDKKGSGRIVKGKKVYSSASEGVVQVAKAAMNVAKKVLATQGGGKFAKNTKTGSQTVSPKKKEDPNKEDQPNPGITSTTNAKKKSGVVGIATHVDGKKIAKGAKTAVKGYTAMFDAPSSESEV
tara:strand:+ start:1720 stop:3084 length:1365 start_codon:yes stop_codon:yes gene_type:complete